MGTQPEKDFYSEIDTMQTRPGLGCARLVIFFAILASIGSLGVFWMVRGLKTGSSHLVIIPFLQSASETTDQPSEYILTEEALNTILSSNEKRLPIDYLKASITPEGIIAKGILSNIRTRIEFTLIPEAKDGKVVVTAKSVKIGQINAPSWFAGQISAIVNKEINSRLTPTQQQNVESIELDSGQMVLHFKS